MRKNFNIVIILITCLFLFPMTSKAVEKKTSGTDKCVDDHTCLQVCEWENSGYHVYAYYYFADQSWKYAWYYPWNPFLAERSASGLPTKNIFYENDSIKNQLSSKGTCPSGAYVDKSGMGIAPELCFDTKKKVKGDKTYCHEASNMGTDFSDTSKLVYTMDQQIKIYFDNYAIPEVNNTSCDTLADTSGYLVDTDKIDDLLAKISTDFGHNFLYDNKMPNFIKNGVYSTKYKEYGDKLKLKVNTCGVSLKEKAKTDVQNGTLTQEQYNELFSEEGNLEQEVEEKLEEVEENLGEGINAANPGETQNTVEATCEAMLGPDTTEYLKLGLSVIQIAGVLLAVILGMVDFLGATISGEQDSIKKAGKKLFIRVAMAAILLIVPAILKFLLNTFGMSGDSFCIL